MRKLLAALISTVTLAATLTWASPAHAADSVGWDSGTKCFFENTSTTKYAIVKVAWAYHVSNGQYVYKPYAVHVLESGGATHHTVNGANMFLNINRKRIFGQGDAWTGPSTYTFGPTRLSSISRYGVRGEVGLASALR